MASNDENVFPETNNSAIIQNIPVTRDNFSPRDFRIRPLYRLSVELIETYRRINQVYYEAKAASVIGQQEDNRGGVHNDGYDDSAYDYIIRNDEIFADRYIIKHRIGKGSFGQVFCAYDRLSSSEVAIKIIKSRRPFMAQAQTEIEILTLLHQRDRADEYNLVRLLDTFIYRNHQCLIFEMLSHNLYDLLKNTRFRGISLNLIRKFSRQILKALDFLTQSHVDVIHCDLKPENILLKHPRRSAIKLIDFGSSCFSYGRTYTYIQSRFYRSPEVLLGIPYDHKIDMWSLACVLVEMHCGEPLFAGQDQVDQVCRIVDVMGMPPMSILERSPPQVRVKFFDRISPAPDLDTGRTAFDPLDIIRAEDSSYAYVLRRPSTRPRDAPPRRMLEDVIGVFTGGPGGRRAGEQGHTLDRYEEFLDFIRRMLAYEPLQRLSAFEAALHPFVTWASNTEVATVAPTLPSDTTRTMSLAVTVDEKPAVGDKAVQQVSSDVSGSDRLPTSSAPSDSNVSSSGTSSYTTRHRRLRSRSAPSMHPDLLSQQPFNKKLVAPKAEDKDKLQNSKESEDMSEDVNDETISHNYQPNGMVNPSEIWQLSEGQVSAQDSGYSALTDDSTSTGTFPSGDTLESTVDASDKRIAGDGDTPSSGKSERAYGSHPSFSNVVDTGHGLVTEN